MIHDKLVIKKLRKGDKSAFTFVFTTYYIDLTMFAYTFLKNREASEEVVQDVFVKIWNNREELIINTSLKSFLLKSVQNKCLDYLRHQKIERKYQEYVLTKPLLLENETEKYLMYSELEERLSEALQLLPPEIGEAFYLNRQEGLTYNEIAVRLDVSVRTIEVRISKALIILRDYLKDYFILLYAASTAMFLN